MHTPPAISALTTSSLVGVWISRTTAARFGVFGLHVLPLPTRFFGGDRGMLVLRADATFAFATLGGNDAMVSTTVWGSWSCDGQVLETTARLHVVELNLPPEVLEAQADDFERTRLIEKEVAERSTLIPADRDTFGLRVTRSWVSWRQTYERQPALDPDETLPEPEDPPARPTEPSGDDPSGPDASGDSLAF